MFKMRSKVKFKATRIFGIYHSQYVFNWFLSCRVVNKRDISHFVPWPWKWGQRSKLGSEKDSPHMVSYMSIIDSWASKSKISEILAIFSRDLENEVQRSNSTRRLASYGFLYVHNWFLSSKVNNKRDISHFIPWPWEWGQRSNSRSQEDASHMDS